MGAVGRAGATLGEMPGTGRPGGHLQTVLGSRLTRKHRLQPAPPYLCGAPASGTDNTTERPASSGNGATAVGGASTRRSVDAQVPTASRLLEVGSPRPAVWRSSPCLWKGYCCEAGLPWEEGLAGAEACRDRCPGQKWETGIGAPTPQLPSPLHRGALDIPPSPPLPPICLGKGAQEAGSAPRLVSSSLLPARAWNLAAKEACPPSPARASQLSRLTSSHSACRPPAQRACAGLGRRPRPFPLPALSIPLNGHSQGGWHGGRGARDELCASTPSPGTASSG